ncbi:transposase [Pseudomonas graminis]|uniref:transposase n=2 Tax=Pseudomonas TaxID=286 RepID=UPI0023498934|nr:transposase [Pseudomonas graminis]MDC6383314.1 transposase [Pseudomonas graminis]
MILDISIGRWDSAQIRGVMGMRTFYSNEFKLKAAAMVLDEGQSVPEVCDNLSIGRTALRRWVEQVRAERQGATPVGAKAITAEQQEIQRLKTLLRQKDRDIEILKKASALLLSDSKDHSN